MHSLETYPLRRPAGRDAPRQGHPCASRWAPFHMRGIGARCRRRRAARGRARPPHPAQPTNAVARARTRTCGRAAPPAAPPRRAAHSAARAWCRASSQTEPLSPPVCRRRGAARGLGGAGCGWLSRGGKGIDQKATLECLFGIFSLSLITLWPSELIGSRVRSHREVGCLLARGRRQLWGARAEPRDRWASAAATVWEEWGGGGGREGGRRVGYIRIVSILLTSEAAKSTPRSHCRLYSSFAAGTSALS